jgi:hypothetical protein
MPPEVQGKTVLKRAFFTARHWMLNLSKVRNLGKPVGRDVARVAQTEAEKERNAPGNGQTRETMCRACFFAAA